MWYDAVMLPQKDAGDCRLVELCVSRDLNAWKALVSKYSGLVEMAAACRLKKYGFTLAKEDIEDIRQDVFSSIWRKNKLKSVVDLDDISHWLAVVSGNMAIDYIRNGTNKEQLKAVPIHKKFEDRCLDELLPSRALRTEDDTTENELAAKIDRAIARLPSRERLMIELHLIHGKKYHEISGLMGLPGGTVSSYIKRAKEKLKTMLKEFLIIFAIISALYTSLYTGGFHD